MRQIVCLCCSVRLLLMLFVDNLTVLPAKKTHNVKINKGLFLKKKHSVRVYFQALGPLFLHYVCFSDGVFSHLSGCWIVFLNGHNGSAYFWLLVIQRCSSDLSCIQASAAPSHTGETGLFSWGLLPGRDLAWCHIIRWEGLSYWTRENEKFKWLTAQNVDPLIKPHLISTDCRRKLTSGMKTNKLVFFHGCNQLVAFFYGS